MSEEKNKNDDSLKAYTESNELFDRMGKIKHKIMVLSGKGGVGKSTIAANIAVSLAMEGNKVGLLDTDFHGPSIPTLLNLEGKLPGSDGKTILPVEFTEGLKIMSIGFLLQNKDDAVIWRGPIKMNVIKQLLTEVNWGELDYLIIDFPPGTGDEPLSVAQLIPGMDGAVIVTTPQNLSLNDVRKCINFCRQLNVPVLGVVENMSGLVCPNCKTVINVFKTGGGEKMAGEMGVPFLGKIPIDPQIVEASDSGKPFVYHYGKTDAAKAFAGVVEPLLHMNDKSEPETKEVVSKKEEKKGMYKIAIPVVEGHLSAHFGHCEEF
ncbi:MAG: Mrp/NBP35 family ATP-binding protein, partial [Syntrophobacterales bacterium]|nr:Mrp/NBP35 family ATP-binding protein [Syntrophobacterales bacterium]